MLRIMVDFEVYAKRSLEDELESQLVDEGVLLQFAEAAGLTLSCELAAFLKRPATDVKCIVGDTYLSD